MSSNKYFKTFTIAEAINQGYSLFVEEGDSRLYHLAHCIGDGKLYDGINPLTRRYFLLAKESTSFQLNDTDIPEAICDFVDNQDQFDDEDMTLVGYVADLVKEEPELFNQLKDALNKKFKQTTFHPATDIELIFPK